MLELIGLKKSSNGEDHIRGISMTLAPGQITVFLGAVDAGKTSLLRLIAGLDRPDSGQVRLHNVDITHMPVQARNIAMVYQDFINYPAMSVYENIASPLRVQGLPQDQIDTRVRSVAQTFGLMDLLDRKPLTLSGGQQQRTALARALAKDADVMLLDEPLANLDYKLREEMREELPRLVEGSRSVVVYATTEPTEALSLGGTTATLHEGRVAQFGRASDIYGSPDNLASAQAFSDPPMNLVFADLAHAQCNIEDAVTFAAPKHLAGLRDGRYRLGVRSEDIVFNEVHSQSLTLNASIDLAEITGSETLVHFTAARQSWVAALPGVCELSAGDLLPVSINLQNLLAFDDDGNTVARPTHGDH